MTDFDGDEVVPPLKHATHGGATTGDRFIRLAGVALAGMAAFFPWYVFLNPEKFSVPPLWQDNGRPLDRVPSLAPMGTSFSASAEKGGTTTADPAIDTLATATVPSAAGVKDGDDPTDIQQPFPASTAFRLMHVANGRALIEDSSGMYIVRVGSTLPDNSKLATLEERNGKWVLITSRGDIYERK